MNATKWPILLVVLFCGTPISRARAQAQAPACSGSARAVLECFLRLDAEGLRLKSEGSQAINDLVAWESFPAWDGIAVSTRHALKELPCAAPSPGKTCFKVGFLVAGEVLADFKRDGLKTPERRDMVFELAQGGPAGWQIQQPAPYPPHVRPGVLRLHVEGLLQSKTVKAHKNNALLLVEALRALE
jgi:hypothetical protein